MVVVGDGRKSRKAGDASLLLATRLCWHPVWGKLGGKVLNNLKQGGDKVKAGSAQIGDLVSYEGTLCVRHYSDRPLVLGLVGPGYAKGVGWLNVETPVELVARDQEYDLIPIVKGVIKHDVGAPLTREQLRAVLGESGTVGDSGSGGGGVRRRSGVHHCSSCCSCICHSGEVRV